MARKKARISNAVEPQNETDKPVEVRNMMAIFREIQNASSHFRLLVQLKIEFYDTLSIDEFSEDFFECIRYIMIYEDRTMTEVPLTFCIKFVVMTMVKSEGYFATAKSSLLLKRLVKFITTRNNTKDSLVRFHCMQASRILLSEMTDDLPIPESFFEKIQAMLLLNFWDVKPYVRSEAVRASSRLQDPSDANCAIVIGLMHVCKHDSAHSVRLAALQALAITTKTLQCLIDHVRDVSDLVRKKSFDLLTQWKILKPLSISSRLSIVQSGLYDKSEMVVASCKELLKTWFISSDYNVVAWLKRLDVDDMEKVSEIALTSLLGSLSTTEVVSIVDELCEMMDDEHLVLEKSLSAETAFLWRHLIVYVSENSDKFDGQADRILPHMQNFEKYLRSLFQKPIDQSTRKEISLDEYAEYCTIIKHLLPIVNLIDIEDSYNRKLIIDLIKWAMSSTDIPFNYVEHLMRLLVHLEENNIKICDETVEMINDLLFCDNEPLWQEAPQSQGHKSPPVKVNKIQMQSVDIDQQVKNKEPLRKTKIEIAMIDVKVNELKEAIHNGMEGKQLDGLSVMVDQLKALEVKKKELCLRRDNLAAPVLMVDVDEEEVVVANITIKMENQDMPYWMNRGMESRIIKANIMTITMIKECNMLWSMPSSLRSLMENVILVSVRHTDTCVREKAILALGLCCLLDKDLAVQYYTIFLKSLEVDHDQIKEIAVNSLVDMFVRFGVEPFQEMLLGANKSLTRQSIGLTDSFISTEPRVSEQQQNRCVLELINPIVALLDDKTQLQTIAGIGLSKLIYHHKISSSKILSRLLLMWFNPGIEDSANLKSYLGGFFTSYSLMSSDNQYSIASCFLATMTTILSAAPSSDMSKIAVDNVTNFFLRVTDSKYLLANRKSGEHMQENFCHDELGRIIAKEVLLTPLSQEVKHYVSMLVRLRFSTVNLETVAEMEAMVSTMINKVKDKKCLQLLAKFRNDLQSKLRGDHLTAAPRRSTEMDSLSILIDDVCMVDRSIEDTASIRETPMMDSTEHEELSAAEPVAEEHNISMDDADMESKESEGDVFKKPTNVRITRSFSRSSSSSMSSASETQTPPKLARKVIRKKK